MENSYEDTQEMFESGNDEDENKSPFKQMLSYSQTILEKLEKQNQMLVMEFLLLIIRHNRK